MSTEPIAPRKAPAKPRGANAAPNTGNGAKPASGPLSPAASQFLDAVLGDGEGTLCAAFGVDGQLDAKGSYKFRKGWHERSYPGPTAREQYLSAVEAAMGRGRVDAYFCPALRPPGVTGRNKGGALGPMTCWVDLDGPPIDPVLYEKLEPLRVDSGSPGHEHGYVLLAEPATDLARWERIQAALRDRLGGDPKIADNDVLRLLGTLNFKYDPPTEVEVIAWSDKRWHLAELEKLLGIDPVHKGRAKREKSERAAGTAQGEGELPPRVREAFEDDTALLGERSDKHHHLVGECYRAGWTLQRTFELCRTYEPSTDKYGDGALLEREVARSWAKVEAEAEDEATFEEFWDERPVLDHVRTFAQSRLVSPWATLGAVLARAVCAVGPHVVLPPIIGGRCSLNLFVALVGPSGAGKDSANAAARDVIDFGEPLTEVTPGSGEGIAHAYAYRDRTGDIVRVATAVLFSTSEIDGLIAVSQRQGATLMSELRKAYMGDTLGFQYATASKRIPLEAHSYRMGLLIGVQPGRAGALLEDSDAGTPQRFLWLPVTDPDLPDYEPAEPEPWCWKPPEGVVAKAKSFLLDPDPALVVMEVAASVYEEIKTARRAVMRGQDGQAAMDAHGNLTRLKVAAAFAVLDARSNVSESDWELAGVVRKKSDLTRAGVEAELHRAKAMANRARGKAEGERAVTVSKSIEAHSVATVSKWILGRLTDDWISRAELRRALDLARRGYFGAALDHLVASGQVEAEEMSYRGQTGRRYRRAGK